MATRPEKWKDCKSIDDVLHICAALALGGKPGPGQSPTEADLWAWFNQCPPDAMAKAEKDLDQLAPALLGLETIGSWCFRRFEAVLPPTPDKEQARWHHSLYAEGEIEYGEGKMARSGTWVRVPTVTRTQVPIVNLHLAWEDMLISQRPPHPLLELVRAWLARPLPVQADTTHPKPLLPKPLAHTQSEKKQYLFSPAFYSAAPATQAGEQMTFLPGFGPTAGELETALPLRLFDLGAGIKPRSPAAPVSLRLWVESILATPPARRGRPAEIAPKLGELLAWLYQGKRPMRRDYMAALSRAFNALDSPQARLVYPDRDTGKPTLWRVVSLAAAPVDVKLDDPIRIIVNLPAGSGQGPQINRERLRYWGTRSSAAYRALLNLAYLWYAPGQLQTPANRQKTHWLQAQDPKRYPLLTDGQQTALCYAPTENRKTQQKHIERARHVLAKLAEEDDIRLIDGRILPPASWNE